MVEERLFYAGTACTRSCALTCCGKDCFLAQDWFAFASMSVVLDLLSRNIDPVCHMVFRAVSCAAFGFGLQPGAQAAGIVPLCDLAG
jgi:hypothetical protein